MDAIIGTILIVLFDIIAIAACICWAVYTPISWVIPAVVFLLLAAALYKPHKDVIGWWINKLS